jgi:hypothetical protein
MIHRVILRCVTSAVGAACLSNSKNGWGPPLHVSRVSPAYLAAPWPPEVSDIAPTLPIQEVVKSRFARVASLRLTAEVSPSGTASEVLCSYSDILRSTGRYPSWATVVVIVVIKCRAIAAAHETGSCLRTRVRYGIRAFIAVLDVRLSQ